MNTYIYGENATVRTIDANHTMTVDVADGQFVYTLTNPLGIQTVAHFYPNNSKGLGDYDIKVIRIESGGFVVEKE